jgi:hypothetical protein
VLYKTIITTTDGFLASLRHRACASCPCLQKSKPCSKQLAEIRKRHHDCIRGYKYLAAMLKNFPKFMAITNSEGQSPWLRQKETETETMVNCGNASKKTGIFKTYWFYPYTVL